MSDEINTQGWEAVTAAFERLYPKQTNPLHFGTLISWRLGGPDPLDGISVYDGGDFWHFVTYGFSELYDKECENKDVSGYGFELTMKLKKRAAAAARESGSPGADSDGINFSETDSPGADSSGADPAGDDQIRGMAGILQALGRYSFEGGEVFRPYEYIYTGQENGIDPQGISKLTGFITVPDEAGEIDTPNGKVEFVQLIGMTDRELKAIMNKEITVREAAEALGSTITDYERAEINL